MGNVYDIWKEGLDLSARLRSTFFKQSAQTGDGSSVGLFIRIPEELAIEFPSLAPEDTSPPHVTFLIVGEVPEDKHKDFVQVVKKELSGLGVIKAALEPVDYFVHVSKERRVAHCPIRFSTDMSVIRDRLKHALERAGFEFHDRFPLYRPHTTLGYLKGLMSEFEGSVPRGSWEFNEFEIWGLPSVHKIPLLAQKQAKSKFKNKKEVPKADGKGTTTVYEYSDKQVQHRNREKAKRIEKLRSDIDKIRNQVKKDLKSDDEKKRDVALAVALMDSTYERVGNEASAKEGHFGVTGWQVKHVTFTGGKARVKYVGKSGVSHDKVIEDKSLVSALKAAVEDKSGTDSLTGAVKGSHVNEYLKPYGISAKDIRGYHANKEMQNRLKSIRSEGGKLPSDPKEREKKLKDEWKKALTESAKAVGHKDSTLKNQYLVPGLEEEYLKGGKVTDSFSKKGSLLERLYLATKSDSEKEDEESQNLIKKSPKKKPPRKDRRKEDIRTKDPDMEDLSGDGDPDLSLNYKKVGAEEDPEQDSYTDFLDQMEEQGREVRSPDTGKNVKIKSLEKGSDAAKRLLQKLYQQWSGSQEKADEKGDEKPSSEDPDKEKEKARKEEEKAKKRRALNMLAEMDSQIQSTLAATDSLGTSTKKELMKALEGLSEKEALAVSSAFSNRLQRVSKSRVDSSGLTALAVDKANKSLELDLGSLKGSASEKGEALAEYVFAIKVVANPSIVAGTAVSNHPLSDEKLQQRSKDAYHQYRDFSDDLRQEVMDQIADQMKGLERDTPKWKEFDAILDGLALAASLEDQKVQSGSDVLRPPMTGSFGEVAKALSSLGEADLLLGSQRGFYSPEGRKKVQQALGVMPDEQVSSMLGGGPWKELSALLTDGSLGDPQQRYLRGMMERMVLNDMHTGQVILQAMSESKSGSEQKVLDESVFELADEIDDLLAEARDSEDLRAEVSAFTKCMQGLEKEGVFGDEAINRCRDSDPEMAHLKAIHQTAENHFDDFDPNTLDPETRAVWVQLEQAIEEINTELMDVKFVPKTATLEEQWENCSQWSSYSSSRISGGHFYTLNRRTSDMSNKLTPKAAQRITSDMDKLASLFEAEGDTLGIPGWIAQDMTRKLDLLADTIEKNAGAHFDPSSVAEEKGGAQEQDSDEGYMRGEFTQQENRELRERQQGNDLGPTPNPKPQPPQPGAQVEGVDVDKSLQKLAELAGEDTGLGQRQASLAIAASKATKVDPVLATKILRLAGSLEGASEEVAVKLAEVADAVIPHLDGFEDPKVAKLVEKAVKVVAKVLGD